MRALHIYHVLRKNNPFLFGSTIGLNSDFFFSLTSCYINVKEKSLPNNLAGGRIVWLIPFLKIFSLCEMQRATCRFWTRITTLISCNNNHYVTSASKLIVQWLVILYYFKILVKLKIRSIQCSFNTCCCLLSYRAHLSLVDLTPLLGMQTVYSKSCLVRFSLVPSPGLLVGARQTSVSWTGIVQRNPSLFRSTTGLNSEFFFS